jgi:hypothetical protein
MTPRSRRWLVAPTLLVPAGLAAALGCGSKTPPVDARPAVPRLATATASAADGGAPEEPSACGGGGAPGSCPSLAPTAPPSHGLRLHYELDVEQMRLDGRARCGAQLVRAFAVAFGLESKTTDVLRRGTLTALSKRVEFAPAAGAGDELRARVHAARDVARVDARFEQLVPACETLTRPTRNVPGRWRGRWPQADEQQASAAAQVASAMQRRLDELGVRAHVEAAGAATVARLGPMDAAAMVRVRAALAERGQLELRLVDDETDFVGRAAAAVARPWPEGVVLDAVEIVPAGPNPEQHVHFATVELRPSEPIASAALRLHELLAGTPIPVDQELLLSPLRPSTPPVGTSRPEGHRSYYVYGWPELTNADIASADAREDASSGSALVELRLTSSGAARFAALTADNVRRRIAIVCDGVVSAAPIVMSRIDGGRLTITLGTPGSPGASQEADHLTRVLRAGALPEAVRLRSESQY